MGLVNFLKNGFLPETFDFFSVFFIGEHFSRARETLMDCATMFLTLQMLWKVKIILILIAACINNFYVGDGELWIFRFRCKDF